VKLADLLPPDAIHVGLDAEDLTQALKRLLAALPDEASPLPERRDKFARDLAFGSAGEVQRLTGEVVAVLAPHDEAEGTKALLGVGARPFKVTGEGRSQPGTARAVILLLTSGRLAPLRGGVLPALTQYLKEGENARDLLNARTSEEVRSLTGFMQLPLDQELRVQAALVPVSYRVYPDTPLDEVIDLIVRRELHAVPVVGEGYEVMGIITAGDALRDLLPGRGTKKSGGGTDDAAAPVRTARDVMTRTVMCVSEDQPLRDAATLMVNRDVEQLPVVREGELVGFLTRDAVLRVLFGR
jgi:CBS domain-containing protein